MSYNHYLVCLLIVAFGLHSSRTVTSYGRTNVDGHGPVAFLKVEKHLILQCTRFDYFNTNMYSQLTDCHS